MTRTAFFWLAVLLLGFFLATDLFPWSGLLVMAALGFREVGKGDGK